MQALGLRKVGILAVAALVALLGSCTAVEDNDTSNTILSITTMQGQQGQTGGQTGDDLFSDVCVTTGTSPACTVFNDNGIVTMTALPKDQLRANGQFNTVYFTRYHVTYVRADGRGVPGLEVPYPFDGATDFAVTVGGTTTKSFMIVRGQAKLEPPLVNIRQAGGALLLSVLARIDFYGTDVSGRPVTVTGYLNITFGDFANT